jgi:hypothetical protein
MPRRHNSSLIQYWFICRDTMLSHRPLTDIIQVCTYYYKSRTSGSVIHVIPCRYVMRVPLFNFISFQIKVTTAVTVPVCESNQTQQCSEGGSEVNLILPSPNHSRGPRWRYVFSRFQSMTRFSNTLLYNLIVSRVSQQRATRSRMRPIHPGKFLSSCSAALFTGGRLGRRWVGVHVTSHRSEHVCLYSNEILALVSQSNSLCAQFREIKSQKGKSLFAMHLRYDMQ